MPKYVEVAFNLPIRQTFVYELPEEMEADIGFRVSVLLGKRKTTGNVIALRETPPEGDFTIKPVERVLDTEPLFDREHIDLALWVSRMYVCAFGEALAAMLPGGLRESDIPVFDEAEIPDHQEHTLAEQQIAAIETITASPTGFFYLYGVTGSGKTEVFLQIAKRTLEEGRSIIYLVPEISLTPQVVEAVQARFGSTAALLHSGLTQSQRYKEWMRIKSGEARFVVGARSAVFAPVKDLGLIILDEEHEGSYKSGSSPRYHARQVAMHRIKKQDARLIMGSATPSVEAFHLMNTGSITMIRLPGRLAGGSMPEIEVVSMAGEKASISKRLAAEIRETHREGRQVILFLNRRGFSYFFHCRTCGYEMKCRFCSVSLTYHKSKNRMLCHYCGYQTEPIEVCPECGSLDVGYSGFGTERIEEDIKKQFPEMEVARVDSDTVRKRGALKTILSKFRDGKIDMLLGTQIVAKGLNFPGVKLIGIVSADTGLHLPDFRASERTFSLIVQVSGRAGRFSPDGKVIVQTFKPDHPAIDLASKTEMEQFYTSELEMRKTLSFPPFCRMFRIVFRSKQKNKARVMIGELGTRLTAAAGEHTEILGPAECPLAVIAGNYRFHIIARTTRFSRFHHVLEQEARRVNLPSGVYMEIDVDPVSLL